MTNKEEGSLIVRITNHAFSDFRGVIEDKSKMVLGFITMLFLLTVLCLVLFAHTQSQLDNISSSAEILISGDNIRVIDGEKYIKLKIVDHEL